MSQHTPGPWEVFNAYVLGTRPGISSKSVVQSIVIWGYTEDDELNEADDAGIHGRTPEEAEANARLIAASPELLSAAQDLLFLMDSVEIDQRLGDETDRVFPRYEFDAIRAAVNKAKGQS